MKTLIFLHGALGSSQQFEALKQQLKSEYNILTPDFSGHGSNAGNDTPFSIELFVEDLLKYFRKNNIEKAGIFGYSMGGYVALNFALLYPKKVQSVFTLATKLNWNVTFAEKEVKMLDPMKMKDKIPAFVTHLKNLHGSDHWIELVNNTAKMISELGFDHLTTIDFQAISIPVRLALGDKDVMVSAAETLEVSHAIPNADMLK